MTVSQHAKSLLAIVMNNRPIKSGLSEAMVDQILNKFDKAESLDIFYLCIALGKGYRKLPQGIASSDLYYAIFLKLMTKAKDYDLY